MLDDVLAQGTKNGYAFVLPGDGAVPSVSFTLTGTPQVVGSSSQRMFFLDQSGIIHFDPSGAGCNDASPVVE